MTPHDVDLLKRAHKAYARWRADIVKLDSALPNASEEVRNRLAFIRHLAEASTLALPKHDLTLSGLMNANGAIACLEAFEEAFPDLGLSIDNVPEN
jgi:hypothetical protein